jgi:hypothetical protein
VPPKELDLLRIMPRALKLDISIEEVPRCPVWAYEVVVAGIPLQGDLNGPGLLAPLEPLVPVLAQSDGLLRPYEREG